MNGVKRVDVKRAWGMIVDRSDYYGTPTRRLPGASSLECGSRIHISFRGCR
jgi:hypothetical protein